MDITTNAKEIAAEIGKMARELKDTVLKSGLDAVLDKALEALKDRLKFSVNEEKRFIKKDQDSDTMNTSTVNTPLSDKTVLKEWGYDLDAVKQGSHSTDSYRSGIGFSQSWGMKRDGGANTHIRVQIPTTNNESLEEVYSKAEKYFEKALYVDSSGSKPRYFILTDQGKRSLMPKIVCSTEKGIETSEAMRKGSRRRELEQKAGKDYSNWALKGEDLSKILNPNSGWSTEVTDILDDIKNGDIDIAKAKLQGPTTGGHQELVEKVEKLEKKQDINPDTNSYLNIVKMISTLKILKSLKDNTVYYSLMYETIEEDPGNFLESFTREVNIWLETNQDSWAMSLADAIMKFIQTYF